VEEAPILLATGLRSPEGPLLLPDGTWLVTELHPERGRVTEVLADGGLREVAMTGRPNGLALSSDGAIWVAESRDPALVRMHRDGSFIRELEAVDGVPLLWPNDLCFGPDGALYATDSGLLVEDFLLDGAPRSDCTDLPVDGRVVRFDPRSGAAAFLDRGRKFPNGLAFGPDGLLYVNETYSGDVLRYRLDADGTAGPPELFGNVIDPDRTIESLCGPDGMAFSLDGRLWIGVLGQGDITVLDREGAVERRVDIPGTYPTNVAFGAPGDQRLYVVEEDFGSLESRWVGAEGLPLRG
jgi:gluconolactonase